MIHPTYTAPGVNALLLQLSRAQCRASKARRSMFDAFARRDFSTTNTQAKYAAAHDIQAAQLRAALGAK